MYVPLGLVSIVEVLQRNAVGVQEEGVMPKSKEYDAGPNVIPISRNDLERNAAPFVPQLACTGGGPAQ